MRQAGPRAAGAGALRVNMVMVARQAHLPLWVPAPSAHSASGWGSHGPASTMRCGVAEDAVGNESERGLSDDGPV